MYIYIIFWKNEEERFCDDLGGGGSGKELSFFILYLPAWFGFLLQVPGTLPGTRTDSLKKSLMLGKIESRKRKDEMVRCHHQLNGCEFEQTPGDNEGQGSLACASWGHKESDTAEQLNSKIHVLV